MARLHGAVPTSHYRATLSTLAEATLQVIDQLTARDLLAAVTPERLGETTGYAPSSIRYQLSRVNRAASDGNLPPRTRWSFDREQLLLLALDALTETQIRTAETLSERYLEALSEVERTGHLTPLQLAIKDNLDAFTPGASGDGEAGATERVWAVALAAADGSVDVARRLRSAQEQQVARYLPVHEMGLALTRRVLRDGVTLSALAHQVSVFIEGVATRRRFEPAFDESLVLDSVLSIFYGLTRPAGTPTEPSPAELLARCQGAQ